MAVVTASHGPLLLLDGDLNIVGASQSFADTFGLDLSTLQGQKLSALGWGEWDDPRLRSLLGATASGAPPIDCYEFELTRPGLGPRALVIHAQRLAYLDADSVRLLVAVCDVTEKRADAREKAAALHQNYVLLQEVRHRVANSLQIIASVLMQHAKKTSSEETRGHLKDAHNRVMSIGALERQLSLSGDGEVELRTYFNQLCESLAASMIGDPDQISLTVTGPGGVVDGRVSVSLGLIVTELVINALKYAFPDGRRGAITIDCTMHGPNWTLVVSDDGVGMPTDPADRRKGLGTSIVEALAHQLDAVVATERANPGTRISITHTPVAMADGSTQRIHDTQAVKRPAA